MFEEIHPCLSIVDNSKFGKTMISNLWLHNRFPSNGDTKMEGKN